MVTSHEFQLLKLSISTSILFHTFLASHRHPGSGGHDMYSQKIFAEMMLSCKLYFLSYEVVENVERSLFFSQVLFVRSRISLSSL